MTKAKSKSPSSSVLSSLGKRRREHAEGEYHLLEHCRTSFCFVLSYWVEFYLFDFLKYSFFVLEVVPLLQLQTSFGIEIQELRACRYRHRYREVLSCSLVRTSNTSVYLSTYKLIILFLFFFFFYTLYNPLLSCTWNLLIDASHIHIVK